MLKKILTCNVSSNLRLIHVKYVFAYKCIFIDHSFKINIKCGFILIQYYKIYTFEKTPGKNG